MKVLLILIFPLLMLAKNSSKITGVDFISMLSTNSTNFSQFNPNFSPDDLNNDFQSDTRLNFGLGAQYFLILILAFHYQF